MNRTVAVIAGVILLACLLLSLIANGALAIGLVNTRNQVQALTWQQATSVASRARQDALVATLQAESQQLRSAPTATAAPTVAEASPTVEPSATGTTPATAEATSSSLGGPNDGLMDSIQRTVIELRGLEPMGPVTRTLITQAQSRQNFQQEFEHDYTAKDAQDEAATLAVFDFIQDPNLDLRSLYIRLYGDVVAGYYDPKVKQLFVITDNGPLGPWEQSVFAHEFDHALQDQHFDLHRLGADSQKDSEKSIAVRSLAEGDALLLQRLFIRSALTPDQLQQLQQELGAQPTPNTENIPKIIQDTLDFPYTYGLQFVQDAYQRGNWQAVNALWNKPPVSTEQIVHPDRYRAGDMPQVVSLKPLTDTLGSGWQMADQDTLGEFTLMEYLQNQVPDVQAAQAAEGWGGDEYEVYYADGGKQLAMVLRTTWDTPADLQEFVDAYKIYAARRSGAEGQQISSSRMCWSGKGQVCLSWTGSDALVVLSPDQQTENKLVGLFPDFK